MQEPKSSRVQDLLSLAGPPLVVSAAAECLAGALVAGASLGSPKAYLLALASSLIFGSGSVFGHYFDRATDARHHADRPLPAGRVTPSLAWQTGWALLVPGVLLAAPAGHHSLLAAIGTALLVVLYAAGTKGLWGFGFLTLGAARGMNLLLGMTAEEFGLARGAVAALPVAVYAVGWALFRAGRQPGAPPSTGLMGLTHLVIALSLLLYQSLERFSYRADSVALLIPFLALTLPRFVNAMLDGRRPAVLEAVQYGFLGLTLLEATLAAGYGGIASGAAVGLFALALYGALRRWPVTLVVRPR